jgi:hypothetical protein
MSMTERPRLFRPIPDNKPVEIQWNQQILTADYFVVPKGTPNKQVAMEFIAWATCAQNNGAVSQKILRPYEQELKATRPWSRPAVTNADENTAYSTRLPLSTTSTRSTRPSRPNTQCVGGSEATGHAVVTTDLRRAAAKTVARSSIAGPRRDPVLVSCSSASSRRC